MVSTASNPKEDTFILLQTGTKDGMPTFTKGDKYVDIRSHGRRSGGGDWNGDGIEDFAHEVNRYGWQIHFGEVDANGRHSFSLNPSLKSGQYQIIGHDQYPGRKGKPGWFNSTPYAWPFAGAKSGGKITGIIAPVEDPENKTQKRGYGAQITHINYYEMNIDTKKVTFKGTLAHARTYDPRLSMGDLNGDGCMDIMYAGGVFTKGDDTQIWVLYGKVPNISDKSTPKKWVATEAPKPQAAPAKTPAPKAARVKARPKTDPNEKRAAVYWDMANEMIDMGQIDAGKTQLAQLIKLYPKTTWAKKAQKKLKEL